MNCPRMRVLAILLPLALSSIEGGVDLEQRAEGDESSLLQLRNRNNLGLLEELQADEGGEEEAEEDLNGDEEEDEEDDEFNAPDQISLVSEAAGDRRRCCHHRRRRCFKCSRGGGVGHRRRTNCSRRRSATESPSCPDDPPPPPPPAPPPPLGTSEATWVHKGQITSASQQFDLTKGVTTEQGGETSQSTWVSMTAGMETGFASSSVSFSAETGHEMSSSETWNEAKTAEVTMSFKYEPSDGRHLWQWQVTSTNQDKLKLPSIIQTFHRSPPACVPPHFLWGENEAAIGAQHCEFGFRLDGTGGNVVSESCSGRQTVTQATLGAHDGYRGWYDVTGCGTANDYCRWVDQSRGNPGSIPLCSTRGKKWKCLLSNGEDVPACSLPGWFKHIAGPFGDDNSRVSPLMAYDPPLMESARAWNFKVFELRSSACPVEPHNFPPMNMVIKNKHSARRLYAQPGKTGSAGVGAQKGGSIFQDQRWNIEPAESLKGAYTITNKASGRRLTIEYGKEGRDSTLTADLVGSGVGGNPFWCIQKSSAGNYVIRSVGSWKRPFAQAGKTRGQGLGAGSGNKLYGDQWWQLLNRP